MKRQIVKGLAMLMAIVGLALATAVAANGQGKNLRAQVPFDFIVGEKTMRCGDYSVGIVDKAGAALAIRNQDGGGIVQLSHAAMRLNRDNHAKLVFRRYGNTYFLAQVWMNGNSEIRELAKTKQERAIERELKTIAPDRGETKRIYEVVTVVATFR